MTLHALPALAIPRPETTFSGDNGSHAGMLLFIQYAFMPNRLDYCGAEDHGALLDYWQAQHTDPGLAQILQTFTGALPYLKLIAHSNGIADPFDQRVVNAYWVGNALLDQVDIRQFYASLIERFGKQLQGRIRDYVIQKVPLGARPHHSFHVFDVHSRVGALTYGLEVMENCRVSWGKILTVEPAHFVIQAQPLILENGKLALGLPTTRRALRQVDDKSFTQDAQAGDWISVHWNWACDILSSEQAQRLERYTRHHIRLANQTL